MWCLLSPALSSRGGEGDLPTAGRQCRDTPPEGRTAILQLLLRGGLAIVAGVTRSAQRTLHPGPHAMKLEANAGISHPLGATLTDGGANFSLFSRSRGTRRAAVLRPRGRRAPRRSLDWTRVTNRTYHYWHVFVPGVQAGQLYGYRVHGPFEPERGLRFDPAKLLLDPYGRAVVGARRLQPRGGAAARRQHRHGHEERGRRTRARTTGKATPAEPAVRRARSSTRCMCAGSPAIPVPAWRRRSAARTPA